MDEDSNSSLKDNASLILDIYKVVSVATNITPLASYSNKTDKIELSNPMDIEYEDTSISPKRNKLR